MIPVERHQKILALVSERGAISIAELTETLGVSHMTIRRDVQKLEDEGAVISVSGGIRSTDRVSSEPSHQDKTHLFSREKEAIGYAAAQCIPKESCIYLDAGTTTLALAQHLEKRDDLLVVTNDFVIADFLMTSSDCRLIHTGGTVCRDNRSCVGEATALALRNLSIDIAFISASCWGFRGTFTPHEERVVVKRAACSVSNKAYLLVDSSKYGKVATYLALEARQFDTVFTDAALSEKARNELTNAGLKTVIASCR